MSHRSAAGTAILLLATAELAPPAAAQVSPPVRLDHVILYTGALTQGMAEFARLTGVTPVRGGQHPGRGTQNALVGLGQGAYVELLAPVVDSGSAVPLRLTRWAVGTDDLDALRSRLQSAGLALSDPAPGSRERPDGEVLTWRTANPVRAESRFTPFFIEWGTTTRHPSTTSPSGCSIAAFLITEPDTTHLSTLLRVLDLPVTVRAGPSRGASITLRCPGGQVTFSG